MKDTFQLAVSLHELIAGAVGVLAIYIIARTIGAYVDEHMRRAVKKKHRESDCAACPNWKSFVSKIPLIEKNQADLRQMVLPALQATIVSIQTTLARLDTNVNKLFDIIEESWKEEIKELKTRIQKVEK